MFDPYRKWLGIPDKDQPPNHYRLLGLELYESDLDTIENAADRLMSFVRQYQAGEHAAEAAKILNELSVARLCLMKPATKTAYDQKLREQLAVDVESSESDSADLPIQELLPKRTRPKQKAGKQSGLPLNVLIIGGAGLIVCLVAVFLMIPRRPVPPVESPAPLTIENSNSVATNNTTTTAVTVPDRSLADSLLWPVPKLSPERAGQPVDLLKAVDLTRDVVLGDWQQTSSTLIGPTDSKIYLPTRPPEHYQLRMSARRLEANGGLTIGFMMAGRQGMAAIDGWNSTVSGLFVDGRDANDNCTSKKGKLFKDQSVGEIVLTVHPGHLLCQFNKATVIDWHGDPDRLMLHSGFGMSCRESAFVVTSAKFAIESAELIPIKPEPSVPRLARLDREIDLLPLVDPDRDTERGIWSLNKTSLWSPEGVGRTYLPVVPPEEYTLSVTVEIPETGSDHATFGIGLPVADSICQLTVVNSDCLGLDTIDGRRWNENESRRSGSFLKPGVASRIDCTVTKGQIRCDFDGRTLIDWRGEPNRLSIPGDWFLADARRLTLGSHHHIRFKDLKLGPPKAPPPSPSHPPFSIAKEVDLLALVDPTRDAFNGKWERDGTSLRIAAVSGMSRLVIPSDVPPEYKLTMRVARDTEDGERELDVSLPFSNSQADIVFDGGNASGMHVDYHNMTDNITTNRQPLMVDATPVELTFFVRKTGLKVVQGERVIFDWIGNPLRASWHWARTAPHGRIVIGSWNQKFRFDKLTVEPLPPSSFPAVRELGQDGKLIPLLDGPRDNRRNEWKVDSDSLLSPESQWTRICIPVVPPEKYVLSATVERRSGNADIYFGLIVGGRSCAVPIDGDFCKSTGVDRLDGKSFVDPINLTRRKYNSPLLPTGKSVPVRCYVLPDSIVVKCGDLEVMRWHGDARRLTQQPTHYPPRYVDEDRKYLWLATFHTSFLVRDLELKPLTDAEAAELKQGQSDVYPTKSLLDLPFSSGPPSASPTTPSTTASTSGPWLLKRQPEARALLVMDDRGDQQAAIEACRHARLPFELYPDFPKTDYSRYSLVVVGTNKMDTWGQPANKHPTAFQPLANFVESGGHLMVFNTYNGRNMEHLVPLGVTTSFYHTSTYEKVPGTSEIFFHGAEDLIPSGNYLQQAGNFTLQQPHVVFLRRGPGSFAGEPTLATLRHGKGRLTYCSVEPGYGTPPGYWLLQAGIRWGARGAPVTTADLEQANSDEAVLRKRPDAKGKKLEILEAKYGAGDKFISITPAVAAGAKSGRLLMAVDASLVSSDPQPGVVKLLQLRYRLNGVEELQVVSEYQSIVVGTRNIADSVTDDKFKLIEVRWGVGVYSPTGGIDLTRQFKQLVSRNGLNPTREAQDQIVNGLPDPKFGVHKSLYVQYQYQGKERAAVFTGGALINVGDPPENK